MPIFKVVHPVTGEKLDLESDTEPTDQEKAAVFAATMPQGQGQQDSSLMGAPQRPGVGQRLAQFGTMARRGFRGLGVGAQRLAQKVMHEPVLGGPDEQSMSQVFERASAATKPGYAPVYGERAGAVIGEALHDLPMMMRAAPVVAKLGAGAARLGAARFGAAMRSAAESGTMTAKIGRGAVEAGTLRAMVDAADRGDMEPVEVAQSAVLGGAVPLLAPTFRAVARLIRGSGEAVTTAGTNLRRTAIEELEKNPALLEEFKGTAASVGEKVVAIQKALIEQHEAAGKILGNARKAIGFRDPFITQINRLEQEGFKPADIRELVTEFKLLRQDEVPVGVWREARQVRGLGPGRPVTSGQSGTLGAQAMEYEAALRNMPEQATARSIKFSPRARLRDLYRLRQKVDDFIRYPQVRPDVPAISTQHQALLKSMRSRINKVIERIPGGKALREADELYSSSRELFDDLQKQLATKGKAEDLIERVLMGGDVDNMIGKTGEYAALLRRLEKAKGLNLVDPAKADLAARAFNEMNTKGLAGLPARTLGPKGVAGVLTGTRRLSKVPDALAMPLESTKTQGLLKAAAARNLEQDYNQWRDNP